MENKTVLEIKKVSKSFGRKKIIKNINLNVKSGEIYGFLGPNGAGKTTTIKMILGLLSIDEGDIIINGFDVKKDFEKAMEFIGGIVENPDMYGYMSGIDNLKLYARLRNVNIERVNEIVKLVDLTDRIKDKVSKYSLGMKQRIGLALTLLHQPKILILDEPTNGLDPAGIRQLRDILKKISHQNGVAVFISSHLLSEMQLMCDKIAIIDKGEIIKLETIQEVLQDNEEGKLLDYLLEVNNIEQAIKIIHENTNNEVSIIEESILIKIEKQNIPNIVKILVQNNIELFGLHAKSHSLEEAFLNMTSGGDINA